MAKMGEAELLSAVDSQISDSVTYERYDLKADRLRAEQYFNGDMPDIPAQRNRSKVTARTLSETIGWIMPGLLRVFLSSDRVVVYEPRKPGTEQQAKQATDYVNYVFMGEANGYRVLHDAFHNGLMFGNGIVKHWWDNTPEYCTETHRGLIEPLYISLVQDDEIEILEHSERQEMVEGMPEPITLHDVKIKKVSSKGRLCIVGMPNEEFLLDRNATALDEQSCRFAAHRYLTTRSNLVKQGYDKEKVKNLPAQSSFETEEERVIRNLNDLEGDNPADNSTERVEVFECYIQLDFDGDGVAEWRRIVCGGSTGRRQVLENEEWHDDLPFTDIVPSPLPHRWRGRSVFEETQDLQQIHTVLWRQMLDNLYLANNPQRLVLEGAIAPESMDEVMSPTFGGAVFANNPNAIQPMAVPFVADKSFAMLEFLEMVGEKRTGVSRQSMSLDPDALQNQTATAVNAAQSSAFSKIETYARNIAEIGLKRLFGCILKLIVKNQDGERYVRLRGQFVPMDPRSWNADMDVMINTGLGGGNRDKDAQSLAGIMAKQEMVMQGLQDPFNPVLNIGHYLETGRKLAESVGLKNPESYFPEVSQEMVQQARQEKGQAPDPKAQEAMAKVQMEQQKAQADVQLAQQKAQAEAQLAQQRAQADIMVSRERGQLQIQLSREEAAAKMELARQEAAERMQLMREEAAVKAELRMQEMQIEAQLTAEANRMKAAAMTSVPVDTDIERAT